MTNASCDIVVVGGGMAGLTMAAMLAQQSSCSIMILEAKTQLNAWHNSKPDERVSAFAVSSQRIFNDLGIWKTLFESRVSPFERIEVCDVAQLGQISFDSREIAEPVLGYIIENNLVESVLAASLKTYSHVAIHTDIHLHSLENNDDEAHLVLSDGSRIQSKLMIAADGAQSWVRQAAGITATTYDYQQKGLVATVTTEKPHERIARQHFLASGPLAFLPLQDPHQCSIVWTLPNDVAEQYQALPQDEFIARLENAFRKQLGQIATVSERFLFPLKYQYVNEYLKGRVVLIGDAAHTIHPLAGQGINMGLLDADNLSTALNAANFDFSQRVHRYLRQYERARKADNRLMLNGVHAMQRLFLSEAKSIQKIRSFGLNMTNLCTWLKHQFTRHAIGNRRI